jgi:NifU-like protein
MWNYSEKVYEHFMNPRNVGDVEDPDGVGEVGSMACGDALRLSFKLDDDGHISEAKFKTFGCGSAIASSSILTEMVIGKTLAEAAQITNQDIARELGGLPREKMHCSVMGREALEAAMIDYYKRLGRGVPCDLLTQGVMLCHCYQVTRDTVREAIMQNGLENVEDVTNFTKAGGGCGDCHHDIQHLLDECREKRAQRDSDEAPEPVVQIDDGLAASDDRQRAKQNELVREIQEVLENDIAVALRNDGGDIELVRVRDDKVFVRLTGACAACRAADATLKGWVEAQLRELVRDDLEVIEVKT